MKLLLQIFTWWNGQTLGTRFFTWRKGEKVGEDQFGNIYYKERNGTRRWVIYNGLAEPSRVPPEWHGWLHYTVDSLPAAAYQPKPWQKAHRPNMTGTPKAYRPQGSLLKPGGKAKAPRDYQAWTPK